MNSFKINRPEFNPETGEAKFHYTLGEHNFLERLELGIGFRIERSQSEAFARSLDLAAAIIGVSYYKLKAPENIDAIALQLTTDAQKLIQDVYENGLGEFYARNEIKRFGKINYFFRNTENVAPTNAESSDALVLIGGGKDSLLSVNILDKLEFDYTPFAVNPKGPILSSIERMDQTPLYVRRYLDKEMLRLNNEPGFFNGHVPSTAINSIIATLIAILYQKSDIVLSNERSASEGNLAFDGREVNHQHSKSLAFEKLFLRALNSVSGGSIAYYSLLRPFSELDIAARFSETTRFDGAFSSCNQNFKQDANGPALWCGNCPKCHFVSLIFAPFMSPSRLTSIVGVNVLDDPAKLPEMRELSGLAGHKPWECVGEILEAAAALWHLSGDKDWQNMAVVSALKPQLEQFYGAAKLETAWRELMTPSNEHAIPEKIAMEMFRPTLNEASHAN